MPNGKRKNFWRHQFPVIMWAVFIFVLSSLPGSLISVSTPLPLDKAFHAVIFFIFCFLLNRALLSQSRAPVLSRYRLFVSFLIVVAYGISDELHQTIVPGRSPDLSDALADAVGGLACTVYLILHNK